MIQNLPVLNAMLNSFSTLFILAGFVFIKKDNRHFHKISMLLAIATSALFLVSYMFYHFNKTVITTFHATGWPKTLYLLMLGSHSILAIVILPLIFFSIKKARAEDFAAHKRLVKWTFPLWLYVSFTGVLIYIVLYHFNPGV